VFCVSQQVGTAGPCGSRSAGRTEGWENYRSSVGPADMPPKGVLTGCAVLPIGGTPIPSQKRPWTRPSLAVHGFSGNAEAPIASSRNSIVRLG
jgi:hypothetical protein